MVSFHSYFSLPEGMTLGFSDTAPRKDTAESSLPAREDTNIHNIEIKGSSCEVPISSEIPCLKNVYPIYISLYISLSHDNDIPIGFMMLHDGSPLLYSTGWFLKIANG